MENNLKKISVVPTRVYSRGLFGQNYLSTYQYAVTYAVYFSLILFFLNNFLEERGEGR